MKIYNVSQIVSIDGIDNEIEVTFSCGEKIKFVSYKYHCDNSFIIEFIANFFEKSNKYSSLDFVIDNFDACIEQGLKTIGNGYKNEILDSFLIQEWEREKYFK